MDRKKRICVACNEDGFGPSAFAYYLVREIVEEWRNRQHEFAFELKVIVLNNSANDFNKSIYAGLHDVVFPVRLNRDSLIRLQKPNGEVAVTETLKSLLDYEAVKQDYLNEVVPYLYGAEAAIDIGVPMFASSAARLDVRNRITLFDHSWAKTLRLISSEEWRDRYEYNRKPTDLDFKVADVIANRVEEDERQATDVYIFEPYITPQPFRDHWERLIDSGNLHVLQGVLGGKSNPEQAKAKLNSMLKELGQKRLPDDKKLVLISPGGTPVWTNLLPRMINQFISSTETREYIPVISNPVAPDKQTLDELRARMAQSDRIRWFGFVKGSTQQVIMPAFDLIVTRAGGGTVNDALASGTSFVCVEEPQVQVVLIEQECLSRNFIPALPETQLKVFREDPVRCIDAFFRAKRIHPSVEIEAEKPLARHVLELLS